MSPRSVRWRAAAGLLLAGWVALAGAAQPAAPARPEDYAYGIAIEAPPGGAIYRLTLPEAVYRGATRADLGDLRVFNARGEPVPHALREAEQGQGEEGPLVELPIFPVLSEAAAGPAELQIRIDERGALVGARTGAEERPAEVEAWLFDLGPLATPPGRLELTLEGELVARARLLASDDLSHWRPLAELSLVQLSHGGNRLEQRGFDLAPPPRARYLRLEWPAAARKGRLLRVQARAATPTLEPERRWTEVAVRPAAGEPAYLFDNPGVLAVDRIRVIPPEANSVVRVRVEARGRPDRPWSGRGGGLVYDLAAEGARVTGEPLAVYGSEREWRLSLLSGGAGGTPPRVELGWMPRRLLFVARGEGPFLLAFGRAGVGPEEAPLDPLLAEGTASAALVREAAPGGQVNLGGAARTEEVQPLPWRRILLWALLLAGVGGLAALAWRLFRELPR